MLTTSCARLRLHVVDPDLSLLILVMRHRQIVAIQFRHENARLRAKAAGNSAEQRVVVGILLVEDVDELVSRNVNAFLLGVVGHVVDHAHRRNAGHNLSRIGIQHDQLSRSSGDHEQTMRRFFALFVSITLISEYGVCASLPPVTTYKSLVAGSYAMESASIATWISPT